MARSILNSISSLHCRLFHDSFDNIDLKINKTRSKRKKEQFYVSLIKNCNTKWVSELIVDKHNCSSVHNNQVGPSYQGHSPNGSCLYIPSVWMLKTVTTRLLQKLLLYIITWLYLIITNTFSSIATHWCYYRKHIHLNKS